MPISTDPITPPTIVAQEVTRFTCDLEAMTVYIRFTQLDADGGKHGASDYTLSLIKDGAARFTPEEYASIKGALYRLALEDGVVSGAVS